MARNRSSSDIQPSLVRPWRVPMAPSKDGPLRGTLVVQAAITMDGQSLGSAVGQLNARKDRLIFQGRDLTLNIPNHPFRTEEGIVECSMAGHRRLEVRLNGTPVLLITFQAIKETTGQTVVDVMRRWAASPQQSADPILPPPITKRESPRLNLKQYLWPLLAAVPPLYGSLILVPGAPELLPYAAAVCLAIPLWTMVLISRMNRRSRRPSLVTYKDVVAMREEAKNMPVEYDASPVRQQSGTAAEAAPLDASETINRSVRS